MLGWLLLSQKLDRTFPRFILALLLGIVMFVGSFLTAAALIGGLIAMPLIRTYFYVEEEINLRSVTFAIMLMSLPFLDATFLKQRRGKFTAEDHGADIGCIAYAKGVVVAI